MARHIHVPIIPVADNATQEERLEAYFQWCEKSQQANPSFMLPLGVKKRWWHLLKSEHPFTTKHQHPQVNA